MTALCTIAGYAGCTPEATASGELPPGCPSAAQFLDDYFGYHYSFRWWCVLILMAFIVIFRLAAMLTVKLVNHQQK